MIAQAGELSNPGVRITIQKQTVNDRPGAKWLMGCFRQSLGQAFDDFFGMLDVRLRNLTDLIDDRRRHRQSRNGPEFVESGLCTILG